MNKIKPASSDDLLLVGKVARPHGLKGMLRIKSFAESEDAFLDVETVLFKTVSGEIFEHRVTSITPLKNIFLMALEALNSLDEAEAYRGAELLIPKAVLKREEDVFFWHELLGLNVHLDTGECLGTVAQILTTGSNDIYVVKKEKKEFYIPAIHEVVKEIDLEKGTMIISPMEGLLDLNAV